MKFHRAEIRSAENGYIVNVTHRGEEKKGRKGGDMPAPYRDKEHVAPSKGHAMKIVNAALGTDSKVCEKKMSRKQRKAKR